MSIKAGTTVAFIVRAEGTGLRYHWEFNGRRLPARGRVLWFTATRRRAGTYQAIVRDASGQESISTPAVLEVQPRTASTPPPSPNPTPPPPVVQPSPSGPAPVILVQPQNVNVPEHGTAVFQVTLNNSAPYTTIVWHNENPLEGAHQIPDGLGFDVHSARLEIPNCLNADNYNGLYWIAVTNQSGGTVSGKVRLTVIPAK